VAQTAAVLHGEREKTMDATDAEEPARSAAPPAVPQPAAPPAGQALEGLAVLRDTIFDKLVTGENDVVGLLAYSLSMQTKREWLAAFHGETGREPTVAEMAAYDIGERIDRRLATYRKLAEHALSGNSFWASAAMTPVSEFSGPPAPETAPPAAKPVPPRRFGTGNALVLACGVFVLLVVAAFAARHYIGV